MYISCSPPWLIQNGWVPLQYKQWIVHKYWLNGLGTRYILAAVREGLMKHDEACGKAGGASMLTSEPTLVKIPRIPRPLTEIWYANGRKSTDITVLTDPTQNPLNAEIPNSTFRTNRIQAFLQTLHSCKHVDISAWLSKITRPYPLLPSISDQLWANTTQTRYWISINFIRGMYNKVIIIHF